MDGHVIRAVGGHLAAAHVAAHGDVEQDGEVLHGPHAWGDAALHDGLPVNVPQQAAVAPLPAGLVPGEVVADGPLRHVGQGRGHDAVFVGLVVVAEVEARVVQQIAIPRLGDVDLAVLGPREGFLGQQPEGGPDAGRAGRRDDAGEDAPVAAESALADEARRGVPLLRLVSSLIGHGPHYQDPVLRANRTAALAHASCSFGNKTKREKKKGCAYWKLLAPSEL